MSCGFQNWSQTFVGLSIDAFFCPERLAEILWETENPGKGKLPKTFELEFYDGARAPMTWPFLDTKLDKKNQAAFLSGARWGDGQQVIFAVDDHYT